MAQDIELCDYATISDTMRTGVNSGEQSVEGFAIITVNFCFLPVYSEGDTDQRPFNSSVIEDMCKIEQSQQNSTELCSCCKNLLRRLLREYQALETERDLLRDKFLQLARSDEIQGSESGSGSILLYGENKQMSLTGSQTHNGIENLVDIRNKTPHENFQSEKQQNSNTKSEQFNKV
ncbi:hypothetical protein GBF38_013068 [Nibea albiflora]|uniref:Uncharacterized protein n=1 Tax=Nibea albiflora TaxID=240163 RepID=A0ACB7EZZ2_NIBAL|nr:hypothetical protein GBF38_013068 [Nibea albiflora]